MKSLRVKYRIWVELDEARKETPPAAGRRKKETQGFIVGLGVARLLSAIKETRSLTLAAKKIGYSYKYAWDRTQKIKERLGEPAVETEKGGKGGGGHMTLTTAGDKILHEYQAWDEFLRKCMARKEEILASGILDKNT
ncbi:MAG: LysR family transcriptional regulator [Candidatus Lokiarchaeota archaeon]|nr:LysR family transcriptional regulator [Candidatus Lokiarchaeota archaeon]